MSIKTDIIMQIARRTMSDSQVNQVDQLFKDDGGKWAEVLKANEESVKKLKNIVKDVLSHE